MQHAMPFRLVQRSAFNSGSLLSFSACETVKHSAATSKPLRIIPNSRESHSLTNSVKL